MDTGWDSWDLLFFVVFFQTCVYKVCTESQSWLFKQDNFNVSGPRQRSWWDFCKPKPGNVYRQIWSHLICLCNFYCCIQVVQRELENYLSKSNSSALEATSDCHLSPRLAQLTMLPIEGQPKSNQPKSDQPLENCSFSLPWTFVHGASQPLLGYPEI